MQQSVRQVSTPALFLPLILIAALMLITGRHPLEQWVFAVSVLLGFPLAVIALRRRAAHTPGTAPFFHAPPRLFRPSRGSRPERRRSLMF